MLRWTEFLAHQERYKDLRREVEKERLIQQMLAGCERRDPFYDRVLAWLGRRFVTWGWGLQERYGVAVTDGEAWRREPHPVSSCATATCGE